MLAVLAQSALFSGRLASICLLRMWLCHFNVTRPLDSWHTFLGLSAVKPHYSAEGFICLTLNITTVQQGAVICCIYQVAVSAHLNYTTWLYVNQQYPIGAGFYHCIMWYPVISFVNTTHHICHWHAMVSNCQIHASLFLSVHPWEWIVLKGFQHFTCSSNIQPVWNQCGTAHKY